MLSVTTAKTAEMRARQGARGFSTGAYLPYVTKAHGNATKYCEVIALVKRRDASKTRRVEHDAGSVLGVRD